MSVLPPADMRKGRSGAPVASDFAYFKGFCHKSRETILASESCGENVGVIRWVLHEDYFGFFDRISVIPRSAAFNLSRLVKSAGKFFAFW